MHSRDGTSQDDGTASPFPPGVRPRSPEDEEQGPPMVAGERMSISSARLSPHRRDWSISQQSTTSRPEEQSDPILTALRDSVESQKATLSALEALIQSHIKAQAG